MRLFAVYIKNPHEYILSLEKIRPGDAFGGGSARKIMHTADKGVYGCAVA